MHRIFLLFESFEIKGKVLMGIPKHFNFSYQKKDDSRSCCSGKDGLVHG
jgi:hypothetical protein